MVVSGRKEGIRLGRGTKGACQVDARVFFLFLFLQMLCSYLQISQLNTLKEINVFTLTIVNCFHQKHLEEQIAKADREYEEYTSEDLLDNIREIGDKYKKKASLLKASDE